MAAARATLFGSLHPLYQSSKLSQSNFPQHLPLQPIKLKPFNLNNTKQQPLILLKATENGENETEIEATKENQEQLGAEIKKAMMEKAKEKEKEKAEGSDSEGFLSGVVDEIGKIEWPEFGKVIGTTGVVLGVIAGSSVVLLTVNAVLAELSDRVFAGKGVQDFFG